MGADMLAFQILILGIFLLVIPVIVGSLFCSVDNCSKNLPFAWISGQVLLWTGFQVICVPMILWKQSFLLVQRCFLCYMGFLVVLALVVWLCKKKKARPTLRVLNGPEKKKKVYYILWTVFGALLLFQLFQAGFMAYEEGDDAFYVAISTITVDAQTMYSKLPYTGGETGLDARHGLAPFPIWVAFLANISGMRAVTVAQMALPMVLIVMAYAIYYLIGKHLFAKKKDMLPLFMILVAVLVLYGGYSVYSAENFLLVRTAQGKAVMANIIIPFLFLLSFVMLEKMHREEKVGWKHWVLLALTMVAGCLCSTLGSALTCMLLGIVGVCTVFSYRKWKIIFPMFSCCIIPMVFAVLYLVLD